MDERARYETQFYAEVCVVSAFGEIDMAEAPLLRTAIRAGLDRGADRVIVDFTDVTYLDSTGLGVLVGFAREIGATAGDFVVIARDAQVLRVFEVAGLDGLVRVERSLDEAMVDLMGKTGT